MLIEAADTPAKLSLIRQGLINQSILRLSKNFTLTLAPITALPTRVPTRLYEDGCDSVPVFHRLMDALTCDLNALLDVYKNIRKHDDFVDEFCKIVEAVYTGKEPLKDLSKSIRAYVTRNDFMIHDGGEGVEPQLKQVEINFSSVVGPHVMQELSELHRKLVIPEYRCKLPCNRPRDNLVEGFLSMNNLYRAKYGDGQRLCILWVVSDFESNLPEILKSVEALKARLGEESPKWMVSASPSVVAGDDLRGGLATPRDDASTGANQNDSPIRVSILQWDTLVSKPESLRFNSGRFYINLSDFLYNEVESEYWYEVSILYFRTGYTPAHYPTRAHWILRKSLEACETIVIPSAVSQLVGLKKIQQVWSADDGVLERYDTGNPSFKTLKRFFMDQVDISDEDESTRKMIEEARSNPDGFVLKPQREGGSNNIYGADIGPALTMLAETNRSAHVLMRKINAPSQATEFLVEHDQPPEIASCKTEIGFYGVACWNGQSEVVNEYIGYLLRTKKENEPEGGICINAAVFDTIMLV